MDIDAAIIGLDRLTEPERRAIRAAIVDEIAGPEAPEVKGCAATEPDGAWQPWLQAQAIVAGQELDQSTKPGGRYSRAVALRGGWNPCRTHLDGLSQTPVGR